MKRGCLLAVVLLAVACGEAEPAATSTTEPAPASSPPAPTTTTSAVVATTAEATTTTSIDAVDVEISGGVGSGASVFTYEVGDTVDITVVSDVDDEIHVHGYDLVFELPAGVPVTLDFVADVPGVFEVEVHTGHAHVFDIEVSG